MTRADWLLVEDLEAILKSPYSDEGMNVRPHWADGTPAHTKKIFGVVHRYDLREEFPIITLRKCFWRSAFEEILWIYQKKSNVIKELGSHIWDSWDVGDGTIGKAYGYQIAQKSHYPQGDFDQMEKVIYDLRHDPMSRSIMTSTYNFQDLSEMGLRPCAYSMTYNVTRDTKTGEMILNAVLNQRSQDMITANNWNVVQYSLLLMCIAKEVGMTPGVLMHVIADCHVYDRHIPIAQDMINRYHERAIRGDTVKAPIVIIEDVPFAEMTKQSVNLIGYKCDDPKYNIEVAI